MHCEQAGESVMPHGTATTSGARLSVAVLALLTGCGARPQSLLPDAHAAIERMRASVACDRALQVEGKVDYFQGKTRVRGSVAVLAALPEQVRIDAFSPFGVNLSTLTSDGKSFSLYDLQSRTLWSGAAKACNLARFTRIALPPHVLVQLLRGEAPILVHEPSNATLRWESNWWGGGQYLLEIRGRHEATEQVTLDVASHDFSKPWQQQRLYVSEVSVSQGGQQLYQVMIDGYSPSPMAQPRQDPDGLEPDILPSGPSCSAELPRRLRFISAESETDFILEYQTTAHNPPLLPAVFHQAVPEGVRVMRAECND